MTEPAAQALIRDVQRFGLMSAATVVDRYAAIAEQALRTDPVMAAAADDDAGLLVDTTARMARTYLDLLAGLSGLVAEPPAGSVERLVLPRARAGEHVAATLWLHNRTTQTHELTVAVGDLASFGGGILAARFVSVGPSTTRVEAGGRAELALRIDVPADQLPGAYNGLAVVGPAASDPLMLSIDVLPDRG